MAVLRRRFLAGSAVLSAVAAGQADRVSAEAPPFPDLFPTNLADAAAASLPPLEVIALSRMGYGPRPGDIARVRGMGFSAYVEEQLNPAAIDDSACDARIAAARLKIAYGSVNEVRPLSSLAKTTPQLWPLADFGTAMDWSERVRPYNEVRVATWLRAVYSKRQLRELMVEFWHNHFNVNAPSDAAIAATFPVYDRDVIRKHCLGNFRAFLEDVAKSTAMMYYLDNVSNQAGGLEGGNENYARELFELHTLGSDNYLKFVADPTQIPTGPDGVAVAYVDDDVYEMARCLTGWTIANGYWKRPAQDDGTFLYDPTWHDGNQKFVLGKRIPRSQPDLKDARDVFTMLARHRGTAQHICAKLCRRLVADEPPAGVVEAAVTTWMANLDAPDQIKKVVRTILLSGEFKAAWGQKVKRPFEAIVAYLRATNAQLPNDDPDPAKSSYWSSLLWLADQTGHRLFQWPTPTGHPDLASYWTSTNGMLWRWNLPYILAQDWGGKVQIDLAGQTNLGSSCTQIVDFWIGRLCGYSIGATTRQALIGFLAQGGDPTQPPKPKSGAPDWNSAAAVADRLVSMVQLLAMSPDFLFR
jgi:uncharacterized protein (DUF1800 family)